MKYTLGNSRLEVNGKQYLKDVGGYNGTNKDSSKDVATVIGGKIDSMLSVNYFELVNLRDNGKLIPGQQYRITDYITTTVQENTESAGHQFDIIVTANSNNTLNEIASACLHEGDTYFSRHKSNLSAWQIWYCIDNDDSRFDWADDTNGKGVIYRMIDDYGNDCPYDFKNIKFTKPIISETDTPDSNFYYTFSYYESYDSSINDFSVYNNVDHNVYDNVIKPYYYFGGGDQILNRILFISDIYIGGTISKNTFGIQCYDNTFGNNCHSNTFGNDCYNNKFGNNFKSNTFGNNCYNNKFDNSCYDNKFGTNCYDNTFGTNCYSNTFGNNCHSNTFSTNCYYNTFGNWCVDNKFGTNCESNEFGNYCDSNTFGNNCKSNTFGILYDGYEQSNCSINTFGNWCVDNTFGTNCNSNTFGNGCDSNKFGTNCGSNTFGNYCGSNTFGNYCYNNIFVNYCYCNIFGTTSTSPKSYYENIIFDSCNSYIKLNCDTTGSAKYYRNVKIELGVNNTGEYKTITDTNVNQDYETLYRPKSSKTLTVQ